VILSLINISTYLQIKVTADANDDGNHDDDEDDDDDKVNVITLEIHFYGTVTVMSYCYPHTILYE
jgi:hypothetical protein